MDVKFDALQPYVGILQTDPANALDETLYISSADNLTGTILHDGIGVTASGAIAKNTSISAFSG